MALNISSEEQAALEELKRRTIDCVTPKMLEDNYLFYRFAKARNFNLAEAEFMLRKVLVKYTPSCLMCFDKDGHAVRYTDCGRGDAKGLVNVAKKEESLKYYVYLIEQDIEALLKRHKKFETQMFMPIFDFESFTYATAIHMKTLQCWLYCLKAYIDNYPETLKCAFVINDGWREELLKLIDADVLPAFLGGNKTDPDGNPECNTIVKRGQPVPKSCYMTNERKQLGADFQKLIIPPLCKKEISFEVKEANSNLEWEYDIKSKDIDFSLLFKGETLEPVELIPKQRTDTCYETEKGLFKCEKIGTYTMVLDNSYSWIYPKEVYIRAAINPPKHDNSDK
ncbi:SEC14-like protein 2 [Araneus ventricosus]|uniref:SEC14-like protein 2 n=1 Tax=Araneus ventricosus TaxID=182803 RepID=A0A4Y2LCL5_ARAVE|nr:SEC14-like protein 2 [Araneus ventricosus]